MFPDRPTSPSTVVRDDNGQFPCLPPHIHSVTLLPRIRDLSLTTQVETGTTNDLRTGYWIRSQESKEYTFSP